MQKGWLAKIANKGYRVQQVDPDNEMLSRAYETYQILFKLFDPMQHLI